MRYKMSILICIAIACLFYSCRAKKRLKFVGFALSGDVILIKKGGDTLLNLKMSGVEKSFQSFYEEIELRGAKTDISLDITIDSSGVIVFDSTVVIVKNNRNPYISILMPQGHKPNRRGLFVANEADSSFKKY